MSDFTGIQCRRSINNTNELEFKFVRLVNKRVIPMSEQELSELNGASANYTVTFCDGSVTSVPVMCNATGHDLGFVSTEYYQAFRTAFYAALMGVDMYDRPNIVSITSPSGEVVQPVSFRYISDGFESQAPASYILDILDSEREMHGNCLCDGAMMHWCYAEAIHHLESNYRGSNSANRMDWGSIRTVGANMSYRANLAIMRNLGSYPISRHVWLRAAEDSGKTVQIRVGAGEWQTIGPNGLPLNQQ